MTLLNLLRNSDEMLSKPRILSLHKLILTNSITELILDPLFLTQGMKRCTTRTSHFLAPCIVEHNHLEMNESLPVLDEELEDEELEQLYDTLKLRFTSLTRCISACEKRRYQSSPTFTCNILEDTYHSSSEITPPWFRALLMDGPETFELLPTFPQGLPGTSTEYRDLAASKFNVTFSFVDSRLGIYGGLFVTENVKKNGSRSVVGCSSAKSNLRYSTGNLDVCQPMMVSERLGHSKVSLYSKSQNVSFSKTSHIYSNHSGIATQTLNDSASASTNVWLTNYSYTAMPLEPVFKRRIVMCGQFNMNKVEKRFRIIFILGADDQVKGIYRRQMTSEPCFLTWRIVFSQHSED